MSESVAQDQLRAIVERIERVDVRTPRDLAVWIAPRAVRLAYSLEPLKGLVEDTVSRDRAFTAAGELLGCQNDIVRHRVRVLQRRGNLEIVDALHTEWYGKPLWDVSPLRPELVGYVYGMAVADFPGIVKIGFSADPERRRHELESQFGVSLRIVHYVPGTRLDESLTHYHAREQQMAGEWFDLDGRWRREHPMALFFTAARMWDEMRGRN